MFTAASDFQTTTVSVETFRGVGAGGREVFDPPVDIDCVVEDGRKLVRAANGDEVISETTLYTDLANTAAFTADSKVTVPTRTARVLLAKRQVIGDPDVDHLEVVLT
jgi:hypothetical protein